MRRELLFLATLLLVTLCGEAMAQKPSNSTHEQITSLINPFIGVTGGGNVLAGPCQPFSMVRVNPLMQRPHPTSGYKSKTPIEGFVVTNVSGTGGGGRYGNFAILPQSGALDVANRLSPITDEQAELGYYCARLTQGDILAELTSTEKVGYMRFTFQPKSKKHILLNMSSVIDKSRNNPQDGKCLYSYGSINDDGLIEGFGIFQGGWGHGKPYTMFFSATTDVPVDSLGAIYANSLRANERVTGGADCGFYLSFAASKPEVITVKVAVSPLSIDKAREHLLHSADTGFEQAMVENRSTWMKYLDRFEIEGGTEEQQILFYTSLYRTLVMPTNITGENPLWQNSEPHYWDFYCLWDTFRTVFPLFSIAYTKEYVELIRSLIDTYDHVGWLPDAWVVGGIARQQGGTNADVVVAEAMIKGIKGFDYNKAYEATKKNATVPADELWDKGRGVMAGKHESYLKDGYIPQNITACVSSTLEFAYNDYCMAMIADKMGHKDEAALFAKRSMNCYNLYNPQTGFFWAKSADGKWADNFAPNFKDKTNSYYYEGNPWQYWAYVPHDFAGLIERTGGAKAFESKLDTLFDKKHFTPSNEPDIHAPYLYNYVGSQHKTADRVRAILASRYGNKRNGLPGNDDSGCMSSWYIFSSMGFYPIAGQSFYLIGSPIFDKVTIRLENGRKITVQADNNSEKNRYIQRAYLNGKPLDRSWIEHRELAKGGVLRFEMGSEPSQWASKCVMPTSKLIRK